MSTMERQGGGPENLEWFAIDDFSPGIVQKKNSFTFTGASPSPLGAAQAEDTYRCVALPGGGLGPLPKKFYNYSRAAISAETKTVSGFHLHAGITNAIADFPASDETDPTVRTEEFFVGYGYESGGAHRERVDALKVWNTVPTTVLQLYEDNDAVLTDVYGPFYMDDFRHANGVAGAVGWPCIAVNWVRPITAITGANRDGFVYPSPAAAGTPYTESSIDGGIMCTHQSRIVVATRSGTVASWGAETETIYFSDPMDPGSALGEYINVGPENLSSYGVLASLSANDLFGIKHRGGAYLIQGDLAFPMVRHLPGVVSTGGTECNGIATRLGFVYGVNNGGVYVWQGADESTPLSPQLEDNFWIASGTAKLRRYKGKFATWKDYIIAPNNWLFDMATKGWWRLDTPVDGEYHLFHTSPFNNVLFGARTTFSDASPIVISGWDPENSASSFSWKSQPLPLTYNRRVTVREVQVIAQGVGDITLSVIGSTSDQSKNIVWTLPAEAATHPVLLRKRLSWQGSYVQLQLGSYHSSTGPAPIINAIRGAYHTDQQIAESGEFF